MIREPAWKCDKISLHIAPPFALHLRPCKSLFSPPFSMRRKPWWISLESEGARRWSKKVHSDIIVIIFDHVGVRKNVIGDVWYQLIWAEKALAVVKIIIMALSYPPCLGEARILVRWALLTFCPLSLWPLFCKLVTHCMCNFILLESYHEVEPVCT